MRALNYFKDISTFRLLLLCLLAVMAGLHAHERYAYPAVTVRNQDMYRRVHDYLQDCAVEAGRYLSVQESLAIALALRFERQGTMQPETYGRILRAALNSAPENILDAGVTTFVPGSDARTVAYVSRDDQEQSGVTVIGEESGDDDFSWSATASPDDGRSRKWALRVDAPGAAESRFSIILTTLVSKEELSGGEAVVRAGLDWLPEMLRRLEESGGGEAFFVSPNQDILWLEQERLFVEQDYFHDEAFARRETVGKAKQFAGEKELPENSDFIKAGILGSGWILMVSNPTEAASGPGLSSPTLIFLIVIAASLLLEAGISRVDWHMTAHAHAPDSGPTMDLDAHPRQTGPGAVLGRVYDVLFQYRITNPRQTQIESELKVARQIQFSLVPDRFPGYSDWREFDIHSRLSPAREVGGDYHDFFVIDSNRLVLTVGDVSGKGVPAALYMAVSRTAYRTLARQAANPGELMSRLNDMLVRDNHYGLYVTIASFFVDLPTGRCEYAIAGHPAPIHYRMREGRAEFIDSPREMFVGMKAGIAFPVGKITLAPGDTLLMYTDGVTEARNPAGNELEYDGLQSRFLRSVGAERCQDLIATLESSILEYTEGRRQEDDITLSAFRYWGPGGQKMAKRRERGSVRSNINASDK